VLERFQFKKTAPVVHLNLGLNLGSNILKDSVSDKNATGESMQNMQEKIKAKGEQIFNSMESEGGSIFNKDWWYGKIMDWSMKNDQFKTQMFRFVDVLPSLQSSAEVSRHMKEYFSEGGEDIPSIFNMGLGLGSLAPGLMAGAVKKNVTEMARMFITGESGQDALSVLKKSRKNKIAFTADLLGEACLSESEADDYQKTYLDLISHLAADSLKWEASPQIDEDIFGPIPRVNVSVKLSSLYSQIDVKAWDNSKEKLKERLRPIFNLAIEKNCFVNLDMEQNELKDLTIAVFKDLIMEPAYKSYSHWGVVIQAYLRDSLNDVQMLSEFGKARGVPFTVRLVKGAYWDFETVHAAQQHWPVPVYTIKAESDVNYEDCAEHLLKNAKFIKLAIGSHNVRSVAACMIMAEKYGVDPKAYEIQMLYGMADPIKKALVKMGARVREYAPIGDLLPGMAYLVRRLLENTSNESFLRSKFADGVSTETLLRDPREIVQLAKVKTQTKAVSTKFQNEALLDFGIKSHQENLLKALKDLKSNLGKDYPIHINGKDLTTNRWIESKNPSDPAQIIGRVSVASVTEAELAMQAAVQSTTTLKSLPVKTRSEILSKVADIFHRDRMKLIALEVLEAGKTWEEADGDIAEAIDFCRYYAKDMLRINKALSLGNIPGETSFYSYQAKGVSVVIAPWNFPLAILTGMVAGSFVTGNPVIMKPAEQTPIIAYYLMKAFIEAGAPNGSVNLIQGYGEEVGEFLTSHKSTALICFTGSKAVGLHIMNKVGQILPGQKAVKKVICEMGGKNAIIIDNDADLDEAVGGVLYSAFGYQGQKCSAASRVIVLAEAYSRFVERLIEAAKSFKVGASEEPSSYMGPVIDDEAQARILKMIEQAKTECKMAFQGQVPSYGYFVPPTIFVDCAPNSRIAQDEIFGPVLAVIKAKNIDDALNIANGTEYALTGGLFSRSPANIEKIKLGFEVGNLYINRGITGAMVERHPFGGFKMSGLGSKTGGPDYLIQFMDPKVVTENTLRRGFAPNEDEPELKS
jgi:RHH-type proline utilization regulon transcriptional repressor/proline dehydrogenase/delta 1-pyrroline-5-carboxylate dehydrogenase